MKLYTPVLKTHTHLIIPSYKTMYLGENRYLSAGKFYITPYIATERVFSGVDGDEMSE